MRDKRIHLMLAWVAVFVISLVCIMQTRGDTSELGRLYQNISQGYQVHTVFAAVSLHLLGYAFVAVVMKDAHIWERLLLAFPAGWSLWGISAMVVLISGAPYTFPVIVGTMLLFLSLIAYGIARWDEIRVSRREFLVALFFSLDMALLSSCGLLNAIAAHDTYYHILEVGKAFVMQDGLQPSQYFSMVHVGLMPATHGSLPLFLGFGNLYAFHHCLMLSFLGLAARFLFLRMPRNMNVRARIAVSALGVLLVCSLPPVQLITEVVLTNAYQMLFLSILCWQLIDLSDAERIGVGRCVFIIFLSVTYVLLRVDAPIYFAFMIFCLVVYGFRAWRIMILTQSCVIVCLLVYYAKLWSVIGLAKGTLLSPKTIGMMLLANVFVFAAIIARRYYAERIRTNLLIVSAYLVLLLSNLVMLCLFGDNYIQNMHIIWQNVNEIKYFWGMTFWMLIAAIIFMSVRGGYGRFIMVFVFCAVLACDLGVLRTINGTGVSIARLGWSDSQNRALCSLLPLLLIPAYFAVVEWWYSLWIRRYGQDA